MHEACTRYTPTKATQKAAKEDSSFDQRFLSVLTNEYFAPATGCPSAVTPT
jgi:hypothetical protein